MQCSAYFENIYMCWERERQKGEEREIEEGKEQRGGKRDRPGRGGGGGRERYIDRERGAAKRRTKERTAGARAPLAMTKDIDIKL